MLGRPFSKLSGARRLMKNFSFVVLSALVLGLGLSACPRSTQTAPRPRAQAARRRRRTSSGNSGRRLRPGVAMLAASITESQTALVKQVLRHLSQRSQQEQRGRPVARQLRRGEGRSRRAGRRSRGEDDPQAARRHDAAAGRAPARGAGARRASPRRSKRGSIRPRRSIRIPAAVRSSA